MNGITKIDNDGAVLGIQTGLHRGGIVNSIRPEDHSVQCNNVFPPLYGRGSRTAKVRTVIIQITQIFFIDTVTCCALLVLFKVSVYTKLHRSTCRGIQ